MQTADGICADAVIDGFISDGRGGQCMDNAITQKNDGTVWN